MKPRWGCVSRQGLQKAKLSDFLMKTLLCFVHNTLSFPNLLKPYSIPREIMRIFTINSIFIVIHILIAEHLLSLGFKINFFFFYLGKKKTEYFAPILDWKLMKIIFIIGGSSFSSGHPKLGAEQEDSHSKIFRCFHLCSSPWGWYSWNHQDCCLQQLGCMEFVQFSTREDLWFCFKIKLCLLFIAVIFEY